MAQIYKSTIITRSSGEIEKSVTKLKYKDLMNLIRKDKELSKKKLEVVKDSYLALYMDTWYDGNGDQIDEYIYIPLEGHTLELLSEYHFNYYDWLINSGRANGSSLLRVLRLTSSQHVKRVAPITEDVDTIGSILAEFGLKSTDFFHNAISLATKKQMEVVFRNEDKLRDTASFLKELSANKDLADANGNKLGNNTFILGLLTSASKGFTLSPKQIKSGFKTIGLYKHHASKGTALPGWKFASAESDLRKKVIRLAHQNPHLRSHLLPLVTKSASYQELSENASYEEMEIWVENAIKLYHQNRIELGDVLFPLTSWYQDVHSAIDHIAGGKRSGGVGMSARKLLKWYDEN